MSELAGSAGVANGNTAEGISDKHRLLTACDNNLCSSADVGAPYERSRRFRAMKSIHDGAGRRNACRRRPLTFRATVLVLRMTLSTKGGRCDLAQPPYCVLMGQLPFPRGTCDPWVGLFCFPIPAASESGIMFQRDRCFCCTFGIFKSRRDFSSS